MGQFKVMPHPLPCPHPFPPKLTFVLAEEIRLLRRKGKSVTEIAQRYRVAKSSISAVLKLHTYAPPDVIAVGLAPAKRDLLRELAKDDEISDEQLAAELVTNGMNRRIAKQVGVTIEEPLEKRGRGQRP
jgi:hypothetical protein